MSDFKYQQTKVPKKGSEVISAAVSDALLPVQCWIDLGADSIAVHALEGTEGMSRPLRFEVRLVTADAPLFDPDQVVGGKALLRMVHHGVDVRRIPGILSEASVSATVLGEPEICLVVEPWFALLRHKSDARVFVERSVPEIVTEVLQDNGVPFVLRLREAYPRRPYTVQFCESDFDFVSRLLEDEGIFYAFAQDDDGTLILGDSPAAYDVMDKEHILPFRPAEGLEREHDVIFRLGQCAALGPSQVTLRDFNPEKPSLEMDVTAGGPTSQGVEYYDYPGKYAMPSEGERKARLLAESMAMAAAIIDGASDASALVPGRTFTLVDGPPAIPDGAYVITALSHRWQQGRDLENAFEALRTDTTYRPARVTASPVLPNPLTGFVVGPDGADIHTDALGRVKVRFPWDRRSPEDDTASYWIPVLQDNTGHSMGIPRIGWEVLVGFMEGDPDRPVVLGRVYNGADPFQDSLPANKTVSALQSLTSPGRGGSNMVRMEDKGGSEQIYMQSEKDQNIVVANDKSERVLNTEANNVGGNETIAVGANQTVKVGQSRQLEVVKDESLTVGGSRSRKVGKVEQVAVGANRSVTIAGKHSRRIEGNDTVTTKNLKETVGAVDLEVSLKPNSTDAGKGMIMTVGGAVVELTAKDKVERTKMLRQETVGALVYTKSGQELKIRADKNRSTTVGGMLTVDAGYITLQGKKKLAAEALAVSLEGTTSLAFTVGGSTVMLKGGEISINTGGEIVIEATGSSNLGAARFDIVE